MNATEHPAPIVSPALSPLQVAFLAAYREVGTVARAAKAAGCSRTNHYTWLGNEEYATAFHESHEDACDTLESEARRRAIEGLRRYKFNRQGEPIKHPVTGEPYFEHVYSDNLLIALLRAAKPEKYRDNVKIESGEQTSVRVMFDADWYGNHAHEIAASQAEQCDATPKIPADAC